MRSIRKIKAKYYSREFLKYLLAIGILTVVGGGPAVGYRLMQKILGKKRVSKRQSYDMFSYLKKKGLIKLRSEGNDIVIVLTKEGKKIAGKYQINDLVLERPKKWDKKWRVVIFDIPTASNVIRNLFRRKLKEFGFYRLQKSIWVFPFDCQEEINLLREFLGVDVQQIRFIEATRIENDQSLRKYFKL